MEWRAEVESGERERTRTHETRLRLLGGTERGEADRGRRTSDRRPTTIAAIIHPHPLPPRKPEARTVNDKSGLGGIQSGAHREVKALTDGRTDGHLTRQAGQSGDVTAAGVVTRPVLHMSPLLSPGQS